MMSQNMWLLRTRTPWFVDVLWYVVRATFRIDGVSVDGRLSVFAAATAAVALGCSRKT